MGGRRRRWAERGRVDLQTSSTCSTWRPPYASSGPTGG